MVLPGSLSKGKKKKKRSWGGGYGDDCNLDDNEEEGEGCDGAVEATLLQSDPLKNQIREVLPGDALTRAMLWFLTAAVDIEFGGVPHAVSLDPVAHYMRVQGRVLTTLQVTPLPPPPPLPHRRYPTAATPPPLPTPRSSDQAECR